MNELESPPAAGRNPFRCFDARFVLQSLLAALVIVGVAFAAKSQPKGSATRIAAAVVESLAFGWVAVRSVLAVRRLDELQQRIHLVAIAVSFTAAALAIVAADFFTSAGLAWRPGGAELYAGMVLVWWGAVIVLNRRYR